ncbi:C2 domain containing protein [Histomonas meleagridis]|uniref:C2 domain containing protein n=1 Tax=Histomonas meleagridis TaxID=135588 RepID=UPI003559C0BD|nr:C2 domain containing protein [Histomonas meleagridis]KAH0801268.1 C2 domain containing protein [Histomonas meleagridis]
MLLHVKVIEAKDLPVVDASGSCDGYCALRIGDQKAKTRTIENSLTPKWRNDFHFKVVNFETDILTVELFDHDKVSKDDKIGYYQIAPKFLSPGIVTDQWYDVCKTMSTSKVPKIHLIIHLAEESDTPFVVRPFNVYLTYVRVIEAKLDQKPSGKLQCDLTIDNKSFQKTSAVKPADRIIWEEETCFCTCNWQSTTLTINLKSGVTANSKATVNLNTLRIGVIKKDWFDLINDGKKVGQIRLALHVITPRDVPFAGEVYDPLPAAESLQAYIRVIAARDLKALDVTGTSDPYCTIHKLNDEKNKKKTRIVPKNLNPRWNELFVFDIPNIGESQFVFSVYDHDAVGKDDIIGKATIAATDMGYGKVMDQWVTLYNGQRQTGSLHLLYHIACPGAIPFTDSYFSVFNLFVQVLEGADITKMDTFGKTDPFCKLKLNFDKTWKRTNVREDTFWPVWNECISFVGFDLAKDKLQIELLDKDVTTEKKIGTTELDLKPLVDGMPKEYWLDMTPVKGLDYAGKIHIFLQALPVGQMPFQGLVFTPLQESQYYLYKRRSKKPKTGSAEKKKPPQEPLKPFDKGYTLYVGVMNAINLPPMDSNGYCDGYCILSIKGQKGEKRTTVVDSDLDPIWNEFFALNVLSLSSDVLSIQVKDHDIAGKDDKIGFVDIPIRTLIPGQSKEFEFCIVGNSCQMNGKLNLMLHLARKQDQPFVESLFTYPVLYVRIKDGKNVGDESYFRLQYENDSSYQATCVRSENKWNEELYFPVTQLSDKFKISLFTLKKNDKEVSSILIPNDFKMGTVVDKSLDLPKTKAKINVSFNLVEYGKQPFQGLPPLQPIEKISDKVTLNIRIIEATDVPAMDPNGKSDPYCKIKFVNRPKDKQFKTRVIKKTLNPVWYQDFHLEIKSIRTDTIKISLIDHDDIGKDDKIGYLDLPVSTLQPGVVNEQWYSFIPYKGVKKGGLVHMIIHLADANQVAFQQNPFVPYMLNLFVSDAKDLPKMDIGSLSDPYCLISVGDDSIPIKTKTKYNTLTPTWEEMYSMIITSYQKDSLKILLRDHDKVKDEDMGTLIMPLTEFKVGYIYNKWFDIKPAKGIIVPPPPLPPGDKLEIQVHLIQASNIPSVDANGKADPYCKVSFVGREKNFVLSRRIDNTLNPKWDDQLRLQIISYGSDVLRIELYDFDAVGKDDRISFLDIPLASIPPGITQYGKFNLTPLHGHSKGGLLEMKYQITAPGQVPYVDQPFIPYQLNVRLVDVENAQCKDKNIDSMFSIKLKNDTNSQNSSTKHNLLNTKYNQDFYFLVTDPKEDILYFEHKNTFKNKVSVIGTGEFPLSSLEYGKTTEKTISLTNKGNLKFYVQLSAPNLMPYADIGLPPPVNDEMTLYVKLLDAKGIPGLDNSGMCDPYCKVKLKKRKNEKKTEIKYKTLTPSWNQEFEFTIKSYSTDVFILNMYDYDKFGKDDKIGKLELPIKSLQPGIPEDKYYALRMNVRGTQTSVHLIVHLAAPNTPKFVENPFSPNVFNVCIAEAMDIPKTDVSKTDPYCVFNLSNDVTPLKTNVLDNTLTPQWFANYKLLITDMRDSFKLIMKDEGNVKDVTFASLELPLSNFQFGYVYDEWYDLKPEKSYKNGGKIRLIIHIDVQSVQPFTGIPIPKPAPSPCQSMELCVKVLEAKDIPALDATGSDGYCIMEFIGKKDTIQKTRVIDNSLNPRWNQDFRFKVLSLNSDEFKITIMDQDKISKDDPISSTNILLRSIEPGIINDRWIDMQPFKGSKGGRLHILYHLANTGDVPYVQKPFIPFEAHLRLNNLEFSKQEEGEFYCEVSHEYDNKPIISNIIESGVINFETKILLVDPTQDKIKIVLNKHYKQDNIILSKPVSTGYIALSQFQLNQPLEKEIELTGEVNGKVKIMINILPINTQFTFNLPTFVPFVCANQRFAHIYIKEARNLPRVDVGKNKSIDAYCKVFPLNTTKTGIKGKKLNKQKRYLGITRVVPNSLNPVFNHMFHIPIKSFNTDIIKVVIYDHDKVSKDDKVCTITYKVSEMGNGIIKDEWKKVSNGEIHIISQVTDYNQPLFRDYQFRTHYLYVNAHDAFGFIDKRTQIAFKCFIKGDISKSTSRLNGYSMTPIMKFSNKFALNNEKEDILVVQIYSGDVKSTLCTQCELPLSQFEPNFVYDDYYDLSKDGKELKGKMHLIIHIDTLGKKAYEAPHKIKYLPSDPQLMFNFHLIEAKFLQPKMNFNYISLYYNMELLGHGKKTKQKSREVDGFSNPYFNQYFKFKPKSLNTDTFLLRLMEPTAAGKNYCNSECLIPFRSLQFGKVYDQWVDLYHYKPGKVPKKRAEVKIKYQLTSPNETPFIEKLFTPLMLHFHLSSMIDPKETENDMFFRVQLKKDIYGVSTINQPIQIWEENFPIFLTNSTKDKLLLTAYEIPRPLKEKKEPKKVFDTIIPIDKMQFGQITDLSNDKVKCFGQILNMGQEAFIDYQFGQPPPPQVFEKLMLHLHLIEAVNLPVCDVNRSSDPYCEIKLRHRKNTKIYSPVIRKTLNPQWNYVSHIPIQCLDDDIVKITIRDYDVVTKDEKIGEITIPIKSLSNGQIEDKWYNLKQGKVHIRSHVTGPGMVPFVPQPLQLYQLHLKINEAILEKRASDVVSKYDPLVHAKLNGIPLTGAKTRYLSDTSAPQWYETFTVLLNDPQLDLLTLELRDYAPPTTRLISEKSFKLNEFQIGKTYSDWYTMDNNKDKINIRLQVVPYGTEPFLDFREEVIQMMNPNITLYIKLIECINLASMDSGGNASDAYCTIETLSGKKFKTRTIDNSKNPKWNQYFNIEVPGYGTDSVKISVFDYDTASKDDLIGYIELPIRNIVCGVPEDKIYDLIPGPRVRNPGQIHLLTHLAGPGKMSFVNDPFIPFVLNVKALTTTPLKNVTEPYLMMKIKGDVIPQCSSIRSDINDDFHFLMSPMNNTLLLHLMSHSINNKDNQITQPQEIELNVNELNNVQEKEINFGEKIGKMKLQYQITQFGVEPFNNIPLMPSEAEEMQVHLRILEGSRIIMNKNRMSYCIVSLRKQKNSKKFMTRISTNGLWNDLMSLNVISLNTDEVKIQLMEHKPEKKDKKVAKLMIPLINMKFGTIVDDRYQFSGNHGEIHVISHLTSPLQKPFVPQPFEPLSLQVIVVEAVNCPRVDKLSKNDTYCRIQLENDIRYQTTRTKGDTQSPQWFESFTLYLTDQRKDTLLLRLADKNPKFDKLFAELLLPLKDLKLGVPSIGWYKMKPLSGFKKGGVLNIALIVQPYGSQPINPDNLTYDSIPEELLK